MVRTTSSSSWSSTDTGMPVRIARAQIRRVQEPSGYPPSGRAS
jgi:K+-transporting ATPase c subunit